MRERGKKKDGQRNVIPPQIFNGQEFRGVSKTQDTQKSLLSTDFERILMMMLKLNFKIRVVT